MADRRVNFVLPLVLAGMLAPSLAADPLLPAAITDWQRSIAALGSERFSERDSATKRLAEAGEAAVPLVVEAVADEDPEVSIRAVFVLKLMARSNDPATNQAARRSLRILSRSDDPRSARAAKRVLRSFADQAAQRLRLVGAKLQWDQQGQVHKVDLSKCKIEDEDLRPLSEIRPLQLDLRHTSITDAGLKHLRDQSQLKLLNLKGTRVTDAGLRRLAGLKNLKTLSVERTQVTDHGMAYLKELHKLETLYLGESQVRGPGLENLRALPLSYLSFQRSELGDTVTKHLVALEQLRTLGLDETNVTNACVPALVALSELQVLWLDKTNVTDDCIPDLLQLEGLSTLYVRGTQISKVGVQQLEQAFDQVKAGSSPGTRPSNRR